MRQEPHGSERRRRLFALGALLAACFVVSGIYLALSDDEGAVEVEPGPSSAGGSPTPATSPRPAEVTPTLEPVARTGDARSFAVEVAEALFEWDTGSPVPLSDYAGRLLAVADPTGTESPGLVADLATYLPTATTWADLQTYRTRQWLEVTTARVPSTWAEAAAEGEAYGLATGTTAYTLTGVRRRAGVWDGQPVETAHAVSFTVYLVCGPTYPTCHLLRISKLDHPLP